MPETFSQKMRRCNAGEYQVGDLVSQDNKRDYGFYLKLNIEAKTAMALLGARAMEGLMIAPKILKIVYASPFLQEGVQYKDGQWSIWARKLRELKPGDKGTPEWLCEVCGEPKCYGCS